MTGDDTVRMALGGRKTLAWSGTTHGIVWSIVITKDRALSHFYWTVMTRRMYPGENVDRKFSGWSETPFDAEFAAVVALEEDIVAE